MLERCLAKDPEERYASTRDLARDLAGLRDHISEVSSGAETMVMATVKPRRRYTLPLVLAALAAGLTGWALTRGRLGSRRRGAVVHAADLSARQLSNARFAPDGKTIVYGARWAGEPPATKLFRMQIGSPESAPFDFPGDILAISPSNELAILDVPPASPSSLGTLSRVPMSGGTPRPVLENVEYAGADFSPDGKDLAVAHSVGGQSRLEFPIGRVVYPELEGVPRVSRDGRSIAFWDGKGDGPFAVAVIGRDGGQKHVLSGGWGGYIGAPCWSADGREIWFSASKPGETPALWAVDLTGKERLLRAFARLARAGRRFARGARARRAQYVRSLCAGRFGERPGAARPRLARRFHS